jgi:hypothetical protein
MPLSELWYNKFSNYNQTSRFHLHLWLVCLIPKAWRTYILQQLSLTILNENLVYRRQHSRRNHLLHSESIIHKTIKYVSIPRSTIWHSPSIHYQSCHIAFFLIKTKHQDFTCIYDQSVWYSKFGVQTFSINIPISCENTGWIHSLNDNLT